MHSYAMHSIQWTQTLPLSLSHASNPPRHTYNIAATTPTASAPIPPTTPSTLTLPAAPVAFCAAALPVAVPPVAVLPVAEPPVAVVFVPTLPVAVLVLPIPLPLPLAPIAFCCPAVITTGRNTPLRSLATNVTTCLPSDRVLKLGPDVIAGADADADSGAYADSMSVPLAMAGMSVRVSLAMAGMSVPVSLGKLEEAVQRARVVPVSWQDTAAVEESEL